MVGNIMDMSDKDMQFIREDIASGGIHTKMIMISQFASKLKEENPNITKDEIMNEIVKFRKEKGWDS